MTKIVILTYLDVPAEALADLSSHAPHRCYFSSRSLSPGYFSSRPPRFAPGEITL